MELIHLDDEEHSDDEVEVLGVFRPENMVANNVLHTLSRVNNPTSRGGPGSSRSQISMTSSLAIVFIF